MAKGRVGVLEVHEGLKNCEPKVRCGAAIAEIMVKQCEARRIGKRLIQMVRLNAREAIRQAKAARDAALRAAEVKIGFLDGPLGIGNLLPFAKPHCDGSKLHYEIPMAGDKSLLHRYRLSRREDDMGISRLQTRTLHVSSCNLFRHQAIPA